MLTEVHVYAVAVAANMLLAFFPFLIVLVSVCTHAFQWPSGAQAVLITVKDYFPGDISRPIEGITNYPGSVQFISILLLLFTANGVFVPMEVALNHIWGCSKNRSYIRNQLVSGSLILACGALAMVATVFTALANGVLEQAVGPNEVNSNLVGSILGKLAAIPISICAVFLIYWLLPNCKIDPRRVLPAAIRVGVLLEVLKYINLFTWSWLNKKLADEYGPFEYAVALVLWGFLASMLILGGAEWASRRGNTVPPAQSQ
jgi:YihY family inner membrane protein